MNAPRDKSHGALLLEALKDPAEAAAYIEVVMGGDTLGTLLWVLRQVAKAHGMAELARRADLGDKTLFKALSENGNPTIETVNKMLPAVGLRLSVVPAASEAAHA